MPLEKPLSLKNEGSVASLPALVITLYAPLQLFLSVFSVC